MLPRPEAKSTGKILSSLMASCSAGIKCSSAIVPLSKNSSINSSLPSATISTSFSWASFAAAAHFVRVSLHGYQINHALEALFTADGNLYRHNQPAESADQAFERRFPIGAFAVHAAHADHAWQSDLVGILP